MLILDRYVLKTFLWNYLLSLGVLLGMYITLDIVLNFDEIFKTTQSVQGNTSGVATVLRTVYFIIDFYFYRSVLIFVQLSPMIPVLATAFTLLKMTRSNETIATLASGIPLLRTATPIILASLVLTGGVGIAQEFIIPSITPRLIREHQDVGRDARRSFPIRAMEDASGNLLIAARYNPETSTTPASMMELDLVQRGEDRQPVAHVRAERAVWEPEKKRWRLVDGTRFTGIDDEQVNAAPTVADTLPTSLTPDEIVLYRSRQFVELLSIERINQLLAVPRGYGNVDLLRVKHFRLTQYLNTNILLWLIIPCVMTREPRTLKTGGAFLLAVSGAQLGTIFVCQHLAGTAAPSPQLAPYWTPLMALVSPVVFSLAAIVALDRIKT